MFEEFGPFFISNSFISDVQMQAFIPVATPVKDFPAINSLHLYPEAMSAGLRASCAVAWMTPGMRCPSGPPDLQDLSLADQSRGSHGRSISLTAGQSYLKENVLQAHSWKKNTPVH